MSKHRLALRTSRTSRLLVAAALVLLQHGAASAADRSFPCLNGSAGKTLRWSAGWQNDRRDDEHHYQIKDILHFETNSSYSLVLSLVGEANAVKPERHLAVASAASAQAVCERIAKNPGSVSVPPLPRVEDEQPRREPQFIRFHRRSWVRSDLPRAQMPLTTCEIMGREFLCLEDKERFGDQLDLVAEQIEAQPSLRH